MTRAELIDRMAKAFPWARPEIIVQMVDKWIRDRWIEVVQ